MPPFSIAAISIRPMSASQALCDVMRRHAGIEDFAFRSRSGACRSSPGILNRPLIGVMNPL